MCERVCHGYWYAFQGGFTPSTVTRMKPLQKTRNSFKMNPILSGDFFCYFDFDFVFVITVCTDFQIWKMNFLGSLLGKCE